MSKILLEKNINKALHEIEMSKEKNNKRTMRQKYHFMAETGWINDPNGLIFYKGKYHFFFQYNPYDAFWGSMHWGHAVSDDLLHWEYLPIALAPSEIYDNDKEGGCFSGSAIEWEDKLYLIYTGTVETERGFVQTQCLAWSEDGIHFEKYEKNPIVTAPDWIEENNFRDPRVWRKDDTFYMLCGGKKEMRAQALLYCSKDLKEWEFVNVMFESRGEYGYMFECPDFFHMGDMSVLTFSPMGLGDRTAVYMVGQLDYTTGKFVPLRTGEIDWGFDYYAPQSFMDAKGRRIMVSWSNCWDWMPWWKDWGPTYKEGWCGFFNIPREVKLMPDYSLQFVPIEEIRQIARDEETRYEIEVGNNQTYILSNCDAGEIRLVIDMEKTTARAIEFCLHCDEQRKSIIRIDLKAGEIMFDRNHADDWSQGITRSTLLLRDKTELDVDILLDRSSIEFFCDKYQNNHSCNVFSNDKQTTNYVNAIGGNVFLKSVRTCQFEKTIE